MPGLLPVSRPACSLVGSLFDQFPVGLRPPVAEELPDLADLLNLVEVEVGDNQFFTVARTFGDDLAARGAEVALPVKLADVPRLLAPDAVDGADEIAVGDCVRGLLQLPQILAQTGDRRRRVEDDLRAVEPE